MVQTYNSSPAIEVREGCDHNKTAAGEGRQEYCETISINP